MYNPLSMKMLCGVVAVAGLMALADARPAWAGDGAVEGCFFEAGYLDARIAGESPEARRDAAERRGAELKAAALAPKPGPLRAAAGHADGDINSDEEALAKVGMCVYPADYVDTLAQGSMAPSRDAAPATRSAETDALIARILAARLYAGGMTSLPHLMTDGAAGG